MPSENRFRRHFIKLSVRRTRAVRILPPTLPTALFSIKY
ncbi:hypothetical protein [Neisseria meningitidis serogroup B]|uniref:Uncharacterized protein n=1 Tax=Neisseria meningitidis serogroup B TaxID=491 RepID=A0A0H5QEB6_NEIMI|nr:hypothetical protein [Neisseria meningitidis serogroup B]